jgi:hypothetical protein
MNTEDFQKEYCAQLVGCICRGRLCCGPMKRFDGQQNAVFSYSKRARVYRSPRKKQSKDENNSSK